VEEEGLYGSTMTFPILAASELVGLVSCCCCWLFDESDADVEDGGELGSSSVVVVVVVEFLFVSIDSAALFLLEKLNRFPITSFWFMMN